MPLIASIQAARWDDDVTQIVVVIVMLAIGAISSIIKKAQERAARKEAERHGEQQAQAPPRAQGPSPRQPAPAQVPAPPRPPGRVYRRQHPAALTPQPAPLPIRRRAQAPTHVEEEEPVHQRVATAGPQPDISSIEQEMERLRERAGRLEQIRRERLAAVAPGEADTAGIEARILHVPAAQRTMGRSYQGSSVDLSDPESLRLAIIQMEILRPPKALRDEPEPWEL